MEVWTTRLSYNWTSKAGAAAAAPDVDLQDYEEDTAYLDSEGPESLAWEDRYQDGGDDYWRMGTGDGVFFLFRFTLSCVGWSFCGVKYEDRKVDGSVVAKPQILEKCDTLVVMGLRKSTFRWLP
jgi:hypothetical protein